MGNQMTIKDVVRITANNLKEICSAPVQLAEQVRYQLAMNIQNLQNCLDAIEKSEAEAAEKAEPAAEAWEEESDET